MPVVNSGFGPTTAFHLFKQVGKSGVGGCALVCFVQHLALSLHSSTHVKENSPLIVAYHRSACEKI